MRALPKVLLLGVIACAPLLACTLNPQPLPPGEGPDSGFTNGGKGNTDVDASQPAPPVNTDAGGALRDATSPTSDGAAGGDDDASFPPGDASTPDASTSDAGTDADASTPDAGAPDASTDADASDADAVPDASLAD